MELPNELVRIWKEIAVPREANSNNHTEEKFLTLNATTTNEQRKRREQRSKQRLNQGCGSGSWKWKRSFFCGSGSAKILPLLLPHKLFDLESNLAKKFCPFPNVDLSSEVAL